jgi:rubredoxin
MNNYDYPLGSDTRFAPWNDDTRNDCCPECGSKDLDLYDSGTYKNVQWGSYICNNCGYVIDNEPDDYDYE